MTRNRVPGVAVAEGAYPLDLTSSHGIRGRFRPARAGLAERVEAERDRLFLWLPVAFAVGIAAYFALPAEPPLVAALLLPLPFAVAALRAGPGKPAYLVAVAGLAAALGFLDAKLRTMWVAAPVVQAETGVLWIEGRVESFQQRADGSARLFLAPTGIEGLAPDVAPQRISLNVRIRDAEARAGTHVRVRAVLMPPPDASHPGGFDYARQVWFERIGAVGYAVAAPETIPAAGPPTRAEQAATTVERLRSTIATRMESRIGGEAGGIAAALVTGYRGGIPDDAQEALRAAGLAHILAISGLHMMLVVGTLFWGVRALLALSPRLAVLWPIKKWAAATALAGGASYLVISGAAIATQRAFIMAAIMMLAILVDRPAITLRNVAIAALAVLALTPEALISASFQMSFAATVALVAGYEALRERQTVRRWTGDGPLAAVRRHLGAYVFALVMTALIAGFATGPYAAFHFNRVAVYGLIGNIGAMPLVGTLIMPPGLIAMCLMPFGLDGPFLWVMGQGIDLVLAVARSVADWPGAVRIVPAFSVWSLGVMTLGGLWLALWRDNWRYWGLGGIAAGAMLATLTPQPDLYVSRNAGMAAVRLDDGSLTFLPRPSSRYVAERWLRASGDGRMPGDPSLVAARQCDDLACVAGSSRLSVALVEHPAAFAEECARADVIVSRLVPPDWCRGQALVIGPEDADAFGAASVSATGSGLAVDTAGAWAGARPWNRRDPGSAAGR